jgi:putative SOS response-associated peptidase YedK
MCGRFFVENDMDNIIALYGVKEVKNLNFVKGEIFPGSNITVVLNNKGITIDSFRWGFPVSSLNKEVINARIETLREKPTFRKAFPNNRCLIPADAFFEWQTIEKSKIKYRIELKNKQMLSMAGIYNIFKDKNNKDYFGVVILTRPANEQMSKLHHRMPVIIDKEKEDKWLNGNYQEILDMLETLETDASIHLNITPAEENQQLTIYDLN